jgi:hypothetical protein
MEDCGIASLNYSCRAPARRLLSLTKAPGKASRQHEDLFYASTYYGASAQAGRLSAYEQAMCVIHPLDHQAKRVLQA